MFTHKNEPEIKVLVALLPTLEDTKDYQNRKRRMCKNKLDMIRRKADDSFYFQPLKGEIILGRRPKEERFHIQDYGPCPHCFEWLKLKCTSAKISMDDAD